MDVEITKKVLVSLVESKGIPLDIYDLYLKFAIGPGQVINVIEDLVTKGYVIYHDYKLQITEKGKAELLLNRSKYFYHHNYDWKKAYPTVQIEKDYQYKIRNRSSFFHSRER